MRNRSTSLILVAGSAFILVFLLACAKPSPQIPVEAYSKALVGRWQGSVGDEKEIMSVNVDGSFTCLLHQRGFIATTLSQSQPGSIRGTWSVSGRIVTLLVDGEQGEHLKNTAATSVVVAFEDHKLTLKSDRGEVSTFFRLKGD